MDIERVDFDSIGQSVLDIRVGSYLVGARVKNLRHYIQCYKTSF